MKSDVIEYSASIDAKLSADSFLIFLDKIRYLTPSKNLNRMIIEKLCDVNLDLLKTKKLLNTYQEHSAEFKFEEKLRMGEIKRFAEGIIPESNFIFDNYKIDSTSQQEHDPNPDYTSFFSSHEQAILKPESTFKNVSHSFDLPAVRQPADPTLTRGSILLLN